MKISKNTEVPLYSFLGLVACLGSNVYLSYPVPEEQRLRVIEEEKIEISPRAAGCTPGKSVSLEKKCLDIVQRYDSLGKEAETLRNSSAYISAQEKHKYSHLPVYVAALFTLTGFLEARSSAKRKREEQDKKGWKKESEAKYIPKGEKQ